MHYGPSLSSNDGSNRITSKMENVATRDLGSNTELSKFDILKLKKMYHCGEKEGTDKLFRCPTEKNGYSILEGQCYFFEKIDRDYSVTQEHCKAAFGPDVVGKMWEPQNLKINNVVSSEAKNIFGNSIYDGFWIGITKDGQFKYLSIAVARQLYGRCLFITIIIKTVILGQVYSTVTVYIIIWGLQNGAQMLIAQEVSLRTFYCVRN